MLDTILKLNLLKELGLEQAPPEAQGKLLLQMSDLVEKRFLLTLLSQLEEKDKQELDQLLAQNASVENWLRTKLPDFDLLLAEVIGNFKQEMLDLNTAVTQKV